MFVCQQPRTGKNSQENKSGERSVRAPYHKCITTTTNKLELVEQLLCSVIQVNKRYEYSIFQWKACPGSMWDKKDLGTATSSHKTRIGV